MQSFSPPHPGLIGFAASIRNPWKRQQVAQDQHQHNGKNISKESWSELKALKGENWLPILNLGAVSTQSTWLMLWRLRAANDLHRKAPSTRTKPSLHLRPPEHLNCQESRKQLEGQAAGYWSWMVALPRLVQHMPKPSKAHGHSVSLFRKVAKMDEGKRTFGWRVLVSFDDTASENKTTATTSTTTPSTFTFYPPAAPTTSEVGVCLLGGGWVPKECWLICKIEPLERPGHSQWTKCHWIHNLQGCIDSHNATMALFSWPFWII